MNDLLLLKLLLNNNIYNIYNIYINYNYYKSNYINIYKLLLIIDILHKQSNKDYSVNELEISFFNNYPKEDKEEYNVLFNKMRELEVSATLANEVLDVHRKVSIATSIGCIGLDVAEGKKDFQELLNEVSKLNAVSQETLSKVEFVTDDLEELLAQTVKGKGLTWRLKTLRKMFGSLRQGDFGFLFARPEVGKTTFLASEVSNFIQQTEGDILWFSNEESGAKIKLRIYQALFNKTLTEILSDVQYYNQEYKALVSNRIKIFDDGAIHKNFIEKVCSAVKPSLIIFDSIDKLKGWKDDRDDLVYKEIYQWSREMAKSYCPIIGVCHASAGAEGKKYLEMDDVAYAKTAKQGEADWILGVGQSHNVGEEYVRYLHPCKNKLMGDEDSIEEMRHGKTSVRIHPEKARFEDIVEWE